MEVVDAERKLIMIPLHNVFHQFNRAAPQSAKRPELSGRALQLRAKRKPTIRTWLRSSTSLKCTCISYKKKHCYATALRQGLSPTWHPHYYSITNVGTSSLVMPSIRLCVVGQRLSSLDIACAHGGTSMWRFTSVDCSASQTLVSLTRLLADDHRDVGCSRSLFPTELFDCHQVFSLPALCVVDSSTGTLITVGFASPPISQIWQLDRGLRDNVQMLRQA